VEASPHNIDTNALLVTIDTPSSCTLHTDIQMVGVSA